MLTAWCLAVAFLSPWVVGAPLVWLLRGCRPVRRPEWLWAPFVGLAAIVCPLHNLAMFADLPLARTAPWLWAVVGALWLALVARPSGRASLRAVPVRTLAVSLVAFLAMGAGLLRHGVELYRGNLESDQFNYVILTQFLTDWPFTTEWTAALDRPWMTLAMALKGDRLGQSVAHGFLAVTAGREALDLFFPTIFLTSALLVPAVRLLAPRLGLFGRGADAAALVAALVPGVTTVVSECYMSHALFVPVLIAYAATVSRAVRRPALLVPAGLLFVLGFACYTEFTPLLVGAGGAAALAARAAGRATWGRAAAVAVAPIAAVALNPAAVVGGIVVATRVVHGVTAIDIPVSNWTMIQIVWLDLVRVYAPSPVLGVVPKAAFVPLCFALAWLGWARAARGAARRRAAALGAGVALMLLPVAVAVGAPAARYVLFKLLFTVAPLYALGVCLVASGGPRAGAGRARAAAIAVIGLWLATATARYQWDSRRLEEKAVAAEWNGVREVAARLDAEPPGEVVVALGGDRRAWVPAGALMYRARRHTVGIASPRQIWMYPIEGFPYRALAADAPPRPGVLVVVRPSAPECPAGEVLVRTEHFLLVRAGAPPAGHALVGP
jgi:hypothetical protein